jgi:hypothetical protein
MTTATNDTVVVDARGLVVGLRLVRAGAAASRPPRRAPVHRHDLPGVRNAARKGPLMFLLFITRSNGFVHVVSFPSLFDRVLEMISLAREPVVLRTADYD